MKRIALMVSFLFFPLIFSNPNLTKKLECIHAKPISATAFQAQLTNDPQSHKNFLPHLEAVNTEVKKDPQQALHLTAMCASLQDPLNPATWTSLVRCQFLVDTLRANGIDPTLKDKK